MILPLSIDMEDLDGEEMPAEERAPERLSPWVYHTTLCQTAIVKHRFNQALRKKPDNLEFLIRDADEALANIIDHLPEHLQPNIEDQPHHKHLEEQYPWLEWQRLDLVTNLFLARSTINYQSREYWDHAHPNYLGRRTVCLEAARSIICLFDMSNLPTHQRRYMYVSRSRGNTTQF